ncbi:MAG: NAD(P)-binding protein [Bacilli bacterium]|nr:NAD(P)-binding protein [Bacilli bacterium]
MKKVIIVGAGMGGLTAAAYLCKENYAVLGGFHLKENNNQLNLTMKYFIENKINKLYLGHCTSDLVIDVMKENLSDKIELDLLKCGSIIEL